MIQAEVNPPARRKGRMKVSANIQIEQSHIIVGPPKATGSASIHTLSCQVTLKFRGRRLTA
jgi:hypothetical protein